MHPSPPNNNWKSPAALLYSRTCVISLGVSNGNKAPLRVSRMNPSRFPTDPLRFRPTTTYQSSRLNHAPFPFGTLLMSNTSENMRLHPIRTFTFSTPPADTLNTPVSPRKYV